MGLKNEIFKGLIELNDAINDTASASLMTASAARLAGNKLKRKYLVMSVELIDAPLQKTVQLLMGKLEPDREIEEIDF